MTHKRKLPRCRQNQITASDYRSQSHISRARSVVVEENREWNDVAERCLNQVPLTAERLLDSEESNSRPLEAAGCRILSREVVQVYVPAWTNIYSAEVSSSRRRRDRLTEPLYLSDAEICYLSNRCTRREAQFDCQVKLKYFLLSRSWIVVFVSLLIDTFCAVFWAGLWQTTNP